jgi:hypothetical protein
MEAAASLGSMKLVLLPWIGDVPEFVLKSGLELERQAEAAEEEQSWKQDGEAAP